MGSARPAHWARHRGPGSSPGDITRPQQGAGSAAKTEFDARVTGRGRHSCLERGHAVFEINVLNSDVVAIANLRDVLTTARVVAILGLDAGSEGDCLRLDSRERVQPGNALGAFAVLIALQLRSDKLPRFDVGAPQLAMHSARELMGADDVASYSRALGAFLSPG